MATFEKEKNRAIINRINELVRDIRELEATIKEIRTSGYSSASLSSAGGSKGYTRQDINTLTSELSRLKIELREARSMLGGSSLIRRIRA